MSAHKAYVHLGLWVELSDDDAAADREFDEVTDAITRAVSGVLRVYDESVVLDDADTVTA